VTNRDNATTNKRFSRIIFIPLPVSANDLLPDPRELTLALQTLALQNCSEDRNNPRVKPVAFQVVSGLKVD